ncbi:MAG TPA: hypothetical protein VFJ18_09805 [Pararhizobium sp.]|nr:hypothetical protein [Pararhizobium sp.]
MIFMQIFRWMEGRACAGWISRVQEHKSGEVARVGSVGESIAPVSFRDGGRAGNAYGSRANSISELRVHTIRCRRFHAAAGSFCRHNRYAISTLRNAGVGSGDVEGE